MAPRVNALSPESSSSETTRDLTSSASSSGSVTLTVGVSASSRI
jgi:hypothetical protein